MMFKIFFRLLIFATTTNLTLLVCYSYRILLPPNPGPIANINQLDFVLEVMDKVPKGVIIVSLILVHHVASVKVDLVNRQQDSREILAPLARDSLEALKANRWSARIKAHGDPGSDSLNCAFRDLIRLLLGKHIFRRRYRQERRSTRALRGLTAACFVVIFGIVAYDLIVVQPLYSQQALTPVADYWYTNGMLLQDPKEANLVNSEGNIPWTVIIGSPSYDARAINAAVKISTTRTFIEDVNNPETSVKLVTEPCNITQHTVLGWWSGRASYMCILPSRGSDYAATCVNSTAWELVYYNGHDPNLCNSTSSEGTTPSQLLITVNYTAAAESYLEAGLKVPVTNGIGNEEMFKITIGVNGDVDPGSDTSLSSAELQASLFLLPNLHLYTTIAAAHKQTLKDSKLAARIGTLLPRSHVSIALTPPGPGLGMKPLSVYGLLHFFQGNRASLAEGSLLTAQDQARIVAILREHLMDIGDAVPSEEHQSQHRDERLTPDAHSRTEHPTIDLEAGYQAIELQRYEGAGYEEGR
ncbi:hypothetical protein NP233_g3175 [Leucocoprinus birnbaumii]|uniref:Uncharacterized protein n=1 Tax=Leucocoprinus birnbaumii TaxID=56174 RepID=A0AAD5VWZ5_9AGAR|nr:hypothetical protein NP233_g3175 [Leucocoprinus birnbaumii]